MTNATLVVELRKFKSSQLASEETLFFRAEIFFNSKKVGYASNDGHGGSTSVDILNQADQQRFTAFIAEQPDVTVPGANGTGFTLKMNEELYISELAEKLEQEKFAKKEAAQRQKFADKATAIGQKAYLVKVTAQKAYLYNLNPTTDIKAVVAQLAKKNKVAAESIAVEPLN